MQGKKEIPKTVTAALRVGFIIDGRTEYMSKSGHDCRGLTLLVRRLKSGAHEQIVVPHNAGYHYGRPRKIRAGDEI
jgi:hypothetical protein